MNTVLGRAASSAGDGTEYVLALSEGGRVICSCAGFSWRRTCRHVKEWLAAHPAYEYAPLVVAAETGGEGAECSKSPTGPPTYGRHVWVKLTDQTTCWWCKAIKEEV